MDRNIYKKLFLLFGLIFVLSTKLVYGIKLSEKTPAIHGFIEHASGFMFSNPKTKHETYNMMEQRLQLKTRYYPSGDNIFSKWRSTINFKGEFLIDEYYAGATDFELRELNILFTPMRIADVRIGRQVLTWGTGDFLFINDMFPKDYVSFYIGRDKEYLKKPSDALRISLYPDFANIDIAVIPSFTPNTMAKGDRLSFFDSFQKGIAGRQSDRRLLEPPVQFNNTEVGLRIYKNFGSYKCAGYFFRGFDKAPRSYKNESLRQLYYERLDVYGGSVRGPVLGGVGNIEIGYYNSREDRDGDNRLIENSFFKALAGYQKDLGNDLNVGFQYFYEQRLDYSDYISALLPRDYFWDEYRHVFTNRITKLFKNQTVEVSLFTFYSHSDDDVYLRPKISYDITDNWNITGGANLVWGEDDITEFGQMEENKNVYFRVRYSF